MKEPLMQVEEMRRTKLVTKLAMFLGGTIATGCALCFLFTGTYAAAVEGHLQVEEALDLSATAPYHSDALGDTCSIIAILMGVNILIVGWGLSYKEHTSIVVYGTTLAAGFVCTILGVPFLISLSKPSSGAFAVPAGGELSSTCPHCVVFFGEVVLFPLLFNFTTVAIIFGFNFGMAKAKAVWKGASKSNGELLRDSYATPSVLFTVPVAILHFVNFFRYYDRGEAIGGMLGFHAFSMLYMNSGAQAFIVTSACGLYLAGGPPEHESDGAGLRLVCGLLLFFMQLPMVILYVLPAMFRWAWLVLLMDSIGCFLMIIAYTNKDQDEGDLEYTLKDKALDEMSYLQPAPSGAGQVFDEVLRAYKFVMFPTVPLVRFICDQLCLKGTVYLPPGARTLMSSLLVLMKTFSVQGLTNVSLLTYAGLPYWDALSVSVRSRHWLCNVCLLSESEAKATQMAGGAWKPFISLLS